MRRGTQSSLVVISNGIKIGQPLNSIATATRISTSTVLPHLGERRAANLLFEISTLLGEALLVLLRVLVRGMLLQSLTVDGALEILETGLALYRFRGSILVRGLVLDQPDEKYKKTH